MKEKAFSTSGKLKSVGKEVQNRSHCLFIFLAIVAIAAGLCLTHAGGVLAADHLEGSVGPLLVKDIHAGGDGSVITDLAEVNDTLFFAANDGTSGCELWKSNGTEAGTVMVKDIYPGANGSAITDLTDVNGTLFFTANDGIHGIELWKSDGTESGTVMVKDLIPGNGSSNSRNLTDVNGLLLFTAYDHPNGWQLWKTDGTESGTVMVKDDLCPGRFTSSPRNLMDMNGLLFFTAYDGTNGWELWKTDGTESGTVMVKDIYPGAYGSTITDLRDVNGTLFFTANDGIHGVELWKSDGTESGTVMVKDLYPGDGSSSPANLTDVNGLLLFTANDGTNGFELWKSDGTESGTVMVKDLYPGGGGSYPVNLTDVNGLLFFNADNTHGRELCKSDGTESGTVMVKDLFPGGYYSGDPKNLTDVNGLLLFTANDGTNGRELWESDGTETGTVMVGDIYPGSTGSSPAYLTNVNGTLYFNANDGAVGSELWRYVPDTPPAVSVIEDQDAWDDKTIGPVSFTISDAQTLSDDLAVRVTSTNQTVLPNANITLAGSADNRTITLTPVSNQTGTTEVTVSVSDGYRTTRKTFTAEWWPALNVPSEYTTIQEAIDAAVDGDIVLIADGIYTGTGNKNMDFGGKAITVRSENGPENTIIDCENAGRAFIFQSGETTSSVLDGLTIRNGSTENNENLNDNDGGAIYVHNDFKSNSPVITNCNFLYNYATDKGGAIYLDLNSGSETPVIRNCSFFGNSADDLGGAIYSRVSSPTWGTANSFLEIANCSFWKNYGVAGGAIYHCGWNAEDKFIITESTFFDNIAESGGAIAGSGNCFSVTKCDFSHNTAENGGAIDVASAKITNSTFWKNTALTFGGGAIVCKAGISIISHCTLSNNTGGGILAVAENETQETTVVHLVNSVLWGNGAGKGNQGHQIRCISGNTRLTVSHTNIEGGLDAISTESQDTVMNWEENINLDPQFALEEEFHLLPDSPCIDAGTKNSPAGELPSTDLEGNIRPLDGNADGSNAPDMGAYEFDRAEFPAAAISPNSFHFMAMEGGAFPEAQTLLIRSRGLGTLNWAIMRDIPWLRLDTTESSSTGEPAAVKLYVDHSDLTHGIYKGHLDIVDSNNSRTYRTVEVTLHVTTELHVPSAYENIQSAIDAAIDGDIVVVADSGDIPYTGPDNMNLDFRGKEITVKSENGPEHTVIDCAGEGRAFHFHCGETSASVVQGFTITNGVAANGNGGGILVDGVFSPTILDCVFSKNSAHSNGGGIAILGRRALVRNCKFDNNSAWVGGGMSVEGDYTIIDNCFFSKNSADSYGYGGGIAFLEGTANIINSEFTGNSAETGGGIFSQDTSISIVRCMFSRNLAKNPTDDQTMGRGGGVSSIDGATSVINCIFYNNKAEGLYAEGGGLHYMEAMGAGHSVAVTNCVFVKNYAKADPEWGGVSRGAGICIIPEWMSSSDFKTAIVKNCILWENMDEHETKIDITGLSKDTVSYSVISDASAWPADPIKHIMNNDPLFIDTTNGDFRLDPSSPCIDAGTMIPDLFSDLRGSVRPIDGDKYGAAEFDIGAFEYSEYYGGLPGDLPAKTFKDLGINASLVVTGFDYHIDWKDRDPFPFDPRIYHSEAYDVNVALVNEYGLRIDLGTHTVQVSQHGYSLPYTFGPEHIGTWRIRLELTSDPNQFDLSDEISIQYKETTRYALSQWIKPPEGADPNQKPDIDNPDTVYWSVETKRLYAIEPTTTVITWYTDEQREVPLPVVAYITYPDKEHYPDDPDTQIHIADSMPVDLLPEGTSFDLVEKMYANNDATISANQFTAGREGLAVLLYRDNQADDPDAKEKFDVVRTYVWDHAQDENIPFDEILNPKFPIESSWDIGKQLMDTAHCEECGNGYVFFEGARYDGYGESRAYERSTREGLIFPVNKDLTGPIDELVDPKDDLVVIWYKKSASSGVCWPSKPVRYNCKWPDEKPIDQDQLDKMATIVIASEYGTGPLDPETFGPMENMLVYAQADAGRPGYNPNDEHAAFFTPPWSQYPVVFPLRTDLNKPNTSDPYILLKYMDPLRDEWNFKVYKVVAQSGSYMLDESGKVVPDKGTALFSVGDLKDSTSLAVKLRDAARDTSDSDPLSVFLLEQFLPETQDLLSEYDDSSPPSESLKSILIQVLNQLLPDPSLYDEDRFAHVTLSQETQQLIEQSPAGEDLIRLNRLLLVEAFPHAIAQSRRYYIDNTGTLVQRSEESYYGSSLVSVDDLKDSTSLAIKLRDADDSDLLSLFLLEQFSPETQQLLSEYDESGPPSESLQNALIQVLNQLLQGPSLYDEDRFAHVTLSQETQQLIAQSPEGEDLIRLNRLLLEEAYPQAIAQSHYYLNDEGLLVNSTNKSKMYNLNRVSGFIETVNAGDAKPYYINTSGELLENLGTLPPESYSLDMHGVFVESNTYYRFHYTGVAGQEINPPYPLNQLTFGPCAESYTTTEEWVLNDKDDKFFAKNGGFNGEPTKDVVVNYFYRLQPGFYYDLDGDGFQDETVGTPIPWLDGLDGTFDGETPVDTTYAISWPDPVPTLFVGETLTDAKTQEGESVGLPNVADQCIVEVLFDQSKEEGGGPAANLVDPLKEYAVSYLLANPESDLPNGLKPKMSLSTGRWVFTALSYHLQTRLTYDPVAGYDPATGKSGELKLKGTYRTGTGEPLLLLNMLTKRDRAVINDLANNPTFMEKVDNLITQGIAGFEYPVEGYPKLQYAEMKALTAGNAQGTGYVTLAFNDHEDCPAPTMLSVIRIGCPLYRGEIKVIESENPFEEKVTLRHNGDFGGKSDDRWFQWKYLRADFSGIPEGPDNAAKNWSYYSAVVPVPETDPQPLDPIDGGQFYQGAVDVTIQGTGQQLLPDKWFSVRYHYDGVCADTLSEWTRPQLYEGWIKRVMKKINLFDQKVKDFHASDVNTLASMISLAGRRYEGDIALSDDPEYLQNLGIVEVYETLLNRGTKLTGKGDQLDLNKALLFAANRLADLYMLLGNEAYADAADPTIGFSTEDGLYGTEAPSIFCFQNQMDSLLEEELALLRGRDDMGVRPFYNRLIWNFTLGDGEVAYKENYNITDQNQDGEVNEQDAMIQYPQGHGDVWGYYLSAVKKYYELLKMKDFTWIPQSEAILVDQTPVEVDYRDERKFAVAAAAKARAGAEIVSLTYHENYVEDPEGQWQGYKDMDTDRAWGVDGWSRRAGQGALFDWVVGNAILPPETENPTITEEQSSADGQRVFTPHAIHYNPDTDSRLLQVFVNDVLKDTAAYEVTCDPGVDPILTTVTFSQGLAVGDAVRFELITLVEGIQRVDRTTVIELQQVASQYSAVQAEVDKADVGLNPLGLAKNVVPFDIDPARIANGETHFEQAYAKAVQAMNNAIAVFNHANQSTQLLRRQQDTLADFKRNIENAEADFNNRLIEVFGYPYPDDCGPGKTYPTDYRETGPDLYHYMYVDPSELMGVEVPKVHQFPVTFKTIDVDATGALQEAEQEVLFHVATDSRFGLIKPPEWQGRRKAPGEIQLARSDLLQVRGRFEKALVEYDNLLFHIEKQAKLLEERYNLTKNEIMILITDKGRQESLNSAIKSSREKQFIYRTIGSIAVQLGNAIAEGIPTVTGIIGGLAAGTITDFLAPLRYVAKNIGVLTNETMSGMANSEALTELGHQQAKEIVSAETNISLTALRGGFAVKQELLQLKNLIHTEATLRYEIYNLAESLQQSAGRYLSALARGERLLQDRLRFRRQTAAQIQNYRYKDMTFRIFRNTALEKYRAQFDMAARYVYLAAKAYDYETTLLDYNSMAGQAFLTDIVRQRTIGLIEGGQPLTGSGLADPMKRMWQNFQVIKPQLGFNNPQEETNRFSLRQELFRIKMDEGSNDTWQQVLETHRVDDLWNIPEFKRYCRPFASEGIPQPGIVIPFPTTVTSGLNFFEWPLGGGDSYYSATNFATKVRSVGVWFSDYNSVHLAETPRIYLVPAGEDVLRTPSYYTKEVRTWHVVDQKLPVPFPIVESELERSTSWIPTVDTLFDEMFQIRRHSDFRAYHDSGYVNESEMTFDSRLVGRSVWNTRWLLIIPGQGLLYDPDEGLESFIHGPEVVGGYGERTGRGVSDVKLFFHTYAYSGN